MIAITRRLEPMDRIDELGDASVPFWFDVHAMVFSSNAPTLEAKLHDHFASGRLNNINGRKEFFRADIAEIGKTFERIMTLSSSSLRRRRQSCIVKAFE